MHASNAHMPDPETTVTQKGQVTIPIEIRKRLGLKPRDRVRFSVERGAVTLSRASAISAVDNAFGAVKPRQRPEDFKKLREEFMDGVAADVTESLRRESKR